MEHRKLEIAPTRRLQKGPGKSTIFIALLIILICAGALLYFLFPEQTKDALLPSSRTVEIGDSSLPVESLGHTEEKGGTEQENSQDTTLTDDNSAASGQPASIAEKPENPIQAESERLDSPRPSEPADDKASICQRLGDSIEGFFDTLDTRPYMHNFNIGKKSSVYFPQLIQKLVNNPPVVSGETDDLYTILQNTAHFFRVIGKKNISILKGILDREKPTFEKTLADFYELTHYPDCLKERFNLDIPKESTYDYAGFFLTTMGGRLYLFRRDSMSRMVVNYYAILIVEQANREGRNKFGIDLKTPINNLIQEIESSSVTLKMRGTYLDALYGLKEKYQ